MSRRKQTKPFKVEEKADIKQDKKPKLRRILPRLAEQTSVQSDVDGNFGDVELSSEADARRSRQSTKCDMCGKVLASSLSLARHKLTHSENKPYQCSECGAGFKTSSNMHRHLRIHFRGSKEQSDTDIAVYNKAPACVQRPPRQNIRTPNKFREFDVDLIGVNARGPGDNPSTNARSYSRTKDTSTPKKPVLKKKIENPKKPSEKTDAFAEPNDDEEELPALSMSRRLSRTECARPEDLVCQICHKSFISKFGLLTHTMSHSEDDATTKCNLCDQTFSTHKGLIVHNVIVHKVAEHKEVAKKERSFKDLAIIDFSAKKFPVVAEISCSNSHCAPPSRDTQHIFMCKKCDKAFPLLESVKLHMAKSHRQKELIQLAEKSEVLNFLQSINLCKVKDACNDEDKKVIEESDSVRNGIDDDSVFTSKLVALKEIPLWLQNLPDMAPSTYEEENKISPSFYHTPRHFDGKSSLLTRRYSSKIGSSTNASQKLTLYAPHNGRRKTRNQMVSQKILRSFNSNIVPADGDKASGVKNVFWCRICNYSSHEKSALVRHLLTHSGIRPYFCKVCDYAFTTKANCERHVRKRHQLSERSELDAAVRCDWELLKKAPREDIYMISGSNSSCPVCKKSFSCNNDLKAHMKIHEERHFVCQLCNVRCTTRNNCVRHVRHKHPSIPPHEANNVITFVGKNDFELADIIMDKPEIDISKGRLGGKRRSKGPCWPRSTTIEGTRSDDRKQPPSKKPCLSFAKAATKMSNVAGSQDSNNAISLPESDRKNQNESQSRPTRCLPLIPLLKIKAYNEAAARSYSEMVALYQHLNFLNVADSGPMNFDNISTMLSPAELPEEGTFGRGETTFICRTCENSFDTEDELNNHMISCEGSEEDVIKDQVEGDNEMLFQSNDNGISDSGNVFAAVVPNSIPDDEESYIGDAMNWDMQAADGLQQDADIETNTPLLMQAFEPSKTGIDSWPETSPFSMKSAEEDASQEYESNFSSSSRLQQSYSKDISCVEDSLLMSMLADGSKKVEEEDSGTSRHESHGGLSLSRYSSFPTMVDMGSPTMTAANYQDGPSYSPQLDDEKSPLSGKARQFSTRKCPQCNKTFPWASSLRRHIMTHTGLKLYMCRLCKMRFTTRSNLIRHVYRRHGMAKQHPEFASCLAKLHPSDTLLREVEADVRRRINGKRKRIPGTRNAYESVGFSRERRLEQSNRKRNKGGANDFQSMLEEDPDTTLVDLDYSPRDEIGEDGKKPPQPEGEQPIEASTALETSKPSDENHIGSTTEERDEVSSEQSTPEHRNHEKTVCENLDPVLDDARELEQPRLKKLRRRSAPTVKSDDSTKVTNKSLVKVESKKVVKFKSRKLEPPVRINAVEEPPKSTGRSKSKQYSNFVCGLCKKIFKNVKELRGHLDTHNVPHSWHCPVCGVPFTNKYNCQRHISRRHGLSDVDTKPVYVEDVKHGPRTARGHPRKTCVDVPALE